MHFVPHSRSDLRGGVTASLTHPSLGKIGVSYHRTKSRAGRKAVPNGSVWPDRENWRARLDRRKPSTGAVWQRIGAKRHKCLNGFESPPRHFLLAFPVSCDGGRRRRGRDHDAGDGSYRMSCSIKGMPNRLATRSGRRRASAIRPASSAPRRSLQAGCASGASMMPSSWSTWAVLCL